MVPKILVVDDDPDIINILSRAFRKKGWDVRSASSVDLTPVSFFG